MTQTTVARRFLAMVALVTASGTVLALQEKATGYLAPGEFNVVDAILPAPLKGDPRYEADRRIFRATRPLLDTPRGAMARADVDNTPAALMHDFSCAAGVSLTPADAPRLLHLVTRALADTGAQNTIAKNLYRRQRPFHLDKGAICEPRAELGDSFDYPSGHATRGWTWGLVLTEVAPDRAGPILARARAYGESRFVCGAHNASAVEASGLATGATMALVRTKPAYRQDLEAARAELAALRADPAAAPPQACAAETALTARSVLAPRR